jgi:penicillin-insensitive murein DD-endopeptidase
MYIAAVALLGLLVAIGYFGNTALIALENPRPSISRGTTVRGRVEHGKRLPTSGFNFRAYSRVAALLGRNSVHSVIRTVVLEAYAEMATQRPNVIFIYGEAGWPRGGPFPPHKTHQNGLSIDFMVPVMDRKGRSVPLPTSPWSRFGYGLEFDELGEHGNLRIDFEAIAEHLAALDRAARAHGTKIQLFLLAHELQPLLWKTPTGRTLEDRFSSMARPAWARHDEHYHIDFVNPAG